jgi:hypothetical protein
VLLFKICKKQNWPKIDSHRLSTKQRWGEKGHQSKWWKQYNADETSTRLRFVLRNGILFYIIFCVCSVSPNEIK